jgi:hypothetical protein
VSCGFLSVKACIELGASPHTEGDCQYFFSSSLLKKYIKTDKSFKYRTKFEYKTGIFPWCLQWMLGNFILESGIFYVNPLHTVPVIGRSPQKYAGYGARDYT